MNMTHHFSGIRAALLLFRALCLPGLAHAQKFVHAYSSISALNAPFWIIQDAGFAKQEGLDTELVYMAAISSPRAVLPMW
jgi:ABC-type nitrate/sulfonate/bicarbonate transport system substrate-binding protein